MRNTRVSKLLSATIFLFAALTASAQDKPAPETPKAFAAFHPLKLHNGPLAQALGPAAAAASNVQLKGPAPQVSRVTVFAVGSSQYGGWEYMTTVGQTSTAADHGGELLRVVVQVIGYDNPAMNWSTMDGTYTAAAYQSESLCIVNGFYDTSCPVGTVVVGWLRYYNWDGFSHGQFQSRHVSVNGGWPEFISSIYIQ